MPTAALPVADPPFDQDPVATPILVDLYEVPITYHLTCSHLNAVAACLLLDRADLIDKLADDPSVTDSLERPAGARSCSEIAFSCHAMQLRRSRPPICNSLVVH